LFMEMIKENRHLYHRDSNLENWTDISLGLIDNVKILKQQKWLSVPGFQNKEKHSN
jgi:hypothetical protein